MAPEPVGGAGLFFSGSHDPTIPMTMAHASSSARARAVAALATALGLVGATAPARGESPSPWSDSERLGDSVYFGVYGGVSFATVGTLEHVSDEDGTRSTLEDLSAPPSFTVAYDLEWWPYDFFGLGGSFEVFGLPYEPDSERFDRCSSDCRRERTPDYGGFGMQVGPTVRAAVPLRYLQPNVGLGLVLPVTFLFTQDPVSRLDQTAWDVGAAVRMLGGLNFLVARDWRIFGEYHLDYRFATVSPGTPLETAGWLRHSAVLGFSVSPDGYKEEPEGDKLVDVIVPFVLPFAGWIVAAIAKGAGA